MADPVLMEWPGKEKPVLICGNCAKLALDAGVVAWKDKDILVALAPGMTLDDMKNATRACK
jgi:hypothetical protein